MVDNRAHTFLFVGSAETERLAVDERDKDTTGLETRVIVDILELPIKQRRQEGSDDDSNEVPEPDPWCHGLDTAGLRGW